MNKRPLGRTGLSVTEICLGTMTWGQQNTEAEGHSQMDMALDHGVTFFDTAEAYSIPPKAETQGSTERIIGTWFQKRKNRDRIILATKVAGRSQMNWFRKDGSLPRHTRAQIHEAIDGSLARLQTDYVDLYQLHWPDRAMQLFSGLGYTHHDADMEPIGDILSALGDLVKAGKVRHIGLSNETAWGTMTFLAMAEKLGLPRVASIQNAYNLVNRSFEVGLAEVAIREQVGLLPYSPLGQGYLTGKYLDGARPTGARSTLFNRGQRYETPSADKAIAAYVAIARKHGLDPAQMAIAFTLRAVFVTSSIIGATTLAQLKTAIGAAEVKLSDAVMADIEAVHLAYSNPCP
jgi:aryl-alcohol dehydrogenase-like predicted oxidoreductase